MTTRNSNIYKKVCATAARRRFLSLAAALAALAVPAATSAQSVFKHWEGYQGLPLVGGMQQVHEHEYYYYVEAGSSVFLMLPFSNYSGTSLAYGTEEPEGYIRWYDHSTDMASSNLSKIYSNSYMTSVKDADGNDRGLFFWQPSTNTVRPNLYTTGVSFAAPNSGWTGTDIACDVSKYTDYDAKTYSNNTYIQREPTLQMRYIFHVKPVSDMADAIKNAAATDVNGVGRTFEDNKRIIFGAKDENATMALRVNQNVSVEGMKYRFYPLTNFNAKSVYATNDAQKIKSSDFGSTMYTANYLTWRIYNEAQTKYCDISTQSTSQFLDLSIYSLKKATWKTVGTTTTTSTPSDIGYGHTIYVVAYAQYKSSSSYYGTSYYCPVANYDVVFQKTHPKTQDQILADADNERSISYLQSHYGDPVVNISFDDNNSDQTLDAPTKANNMSKFSSRYDLRSYGYVYPDLIDIACPNQYPLIHGEYGLFKSANVSGVSDNNVGTQNNSGTFTSTNHRMYSWNDPYKVELYDRTHELNSNQYGYFLYVDASEESRQIAAANFEANLCSGSRLIFSAAATDFTSASAKEQPQLLFRLYGIDRDVTSGKIKERHLIQSFSSGDFESNVKTRQFGAWHQIFGEMTLQRSDAADNYTEFQIVIDNMCKSTNGADYAVDDIRIYLSSSKVDVLQNRPVCEDVKSGAVPSDDITLKIRSAYDNLSGNLNYEGSDVKEQKVFFRFCDTDNNPVKLDYDNDGNDEDYATVSVPTTYSADNSNFETVNDRTYYILANRHFALPTGKSYYVSVAYPDEDGLPGVWATPQSVCSTYSPMFEIVKQNIMVTDANGNVVTTVRIKCDGSNTPSVSINAQLETVDKVNGGKVQLKNVKFDWFFSEDNKANDFSSISGLQEALDHFRQVYPSATSVQRASGVFTSADRTMLIQYVNNGRLLLSASATITKFTNYGRFEVAAIPIANSITVGGFSYDICSDPMMFNLRVVKDGPRVYTGFDDVTYPNDDRELRIGLPQIAAITAKNGQLMLPVKSMEDATMVTLENDGKVWIAETNDPELDLTEAGKQEIGRLANQSIYSSDKTVGIRFNDNATTVLREGYWYELNFSFTGNAAASVSCPGEVFVKMHVVPEYLTWNSSAATLNSNWNNDANWLRSTKDEIYKDDYIDYDERKSVYMPMAFSKVTVPDQAGRIYPNLAEIVYQNNGIANKMGDVAYTMITKWNNATADHSDNGNGSFSCEKWRGNLCDQIYFKPGGELLYANYLDYNKAWVEKELKPNTWSVVSSPMKQTFAGDMYVPSNTGREETEAFKPIIFDESVNSRADYPVYQRDWDGDAQEIVDNLTRYDANDNGSVETSDDNSMSLTSAYWTHVYNRLDEPYANGRGFAIKPADNYTVGAKDNFIVRLPKDDKSFAYYDSESQKDLTVSISRSDDNYRILTSDGNKSLDIKQPLELNVHEGNAYHLIGNPYTATISMYRFFESNTAFENSVWTLENGTMTSYSVPLDKVYDRKTDVMIAPMQAFFVKVKDGEAVPEYVTFAAAMLVNRNITAGEKLIAVKPTLTLNAANATLSSRAVVVENSMANNDFSADEDVELLTTGEIGDVPQVYTVAGTQAVAVNNTDNINFMPVGVVAKNNQEVDVTVALNRQMQKLVNNGDRCIYMFDNKSKVFTPIADNSVVRMVANEHGRYFITLQNTGISTAIDKISCFSPNYGCIVVATLDGLLKRVRVYDVGGKLLVNRVSVDSECCRLQMENPGVYVVKAETVDGNVKAFKIAVK